MLGWLDAKDNNLHKKERERKEETMAGEALSWADQWGAGGVGSMEDDNYTGTKRDTSKKE
ncbi:hypothetical protein SADUNF_Sadunf11G0003200 [Salix dunnii]|uniref:Uncharacterized protein n=1 Tax=Salix dunnii TaxID=1413687 RepID=A0A835JMU9_9ROSI|nr:hypothetical protein SADUNF_Sadunf11G0003200 [Salix dunnii]